MSLLDRHRAALPPATDIMACVEAVVNHGVRRPGTQAGHHVEEWCVSQFRELGLDHVRRESFEVPVWEPGPARLVAWSLDRPEQAVDLAAFALPHTQPTPDGGHEADLVLLGPEGANTAVGGAIAVDRIELGRLPASYMRSVATSRVDPAGELDDYVHLLPFSFRMGHEVDSGIDAGASGYVGVLSGMPWETRDYYLPYDAVERHLPAVWISRRDGDRLLALLAGAEGPVRGRIEVDAARRAGWSTNVVGTLPGASDEWVVVGSHHDAPWASAVEDASGVALVLAQASFWAQVPAAERPHNLMFLLNGGHMAGAAGIASFRERHEALLDDVVLSVHLEHAAAACRVEDDALVATEEPEVRWWFTSHDPALEEAVMSALTVEQLGRSWVLPPEAFGDFPPTDGGGFHLEGVPLVDFLVAPVYLVDACDTLDKVHQPSLEPITRATVRIVESLAGRSAAELRAGAVRSTETH